uniref:Spaetzle domain-containing protein n=1 Tax=Plectus sambesii TaxID=2011161 RepID=A0A914URI8_9BILA
MAVDVHSASRAFPDLADERFLQNYENYVCDAKCQREADNIRKQMLREDPPVTAPPVQQTAPPPIFVPNNNWWHSGFWTTGRVAYVQPGVQPLNRKKRQERSHKVIDDMDASIRKNSGITKGVIGRTIAIQCDRHSDDNSVPPNLYQFCKSCTAVRQLPENYYPRILNEVICGEESCIKGNGKCQQRFLPFKVLQNFGTEECQLWRLVTINLRTCCDCLMDRNSVFMRYFEQD